MRPTWSRPTGVMLVACGLACALAAPSAAQTTDRGAAERRARLATERIRALQEEAEALAAQERGLLVELRQLEIERRIRIEELARVDAELTVVAGRLEDARTRVAVLEQQVVEQRDGVEDRLVELYKLGRAGYVRVLLNVSDLRDIGRAYRTVAALQHLDRTRVDTHGRTLTALHDERKALEARVMEVQALRRDGQEARDRLGRTIRTREQLVRSIGDRRDLNAQLAGELSVAQQRLQAAVSTLAAGGTVDASDVALPIAPFRGALDWPVEGRVTRGFGPSTGSGTADDALRHGVEIAAAEGAAVRALHEGRVAFAEPFTGFGNLVILDHGRGSFSLYGHLDVVAVTTGQRVDPGATVGTVGVGTGGSPSLYFELRIDGAPVDPVQWLKRP